MLMKMLVLIVPKSGLCLIEFKSELRRESVKIVPSSDIEAIGVLELSCKGIKDDNSSKRKICSTNKVLELMASEKVRIINP